MHIYLPQAVIKTNICPHTTTTTKRKHSVFDKLYYTITTSQEKNETNIKHI